MTTPLSFRELELLACAHVKILLRMYMSHGDGRRAVTASNFIRLFLEISDVMGASLELA